MGRPKTHLTLLFDRWVSRGPSADFRIGSHSLGLAALSGRGTDTRESAIHALLTGPAAAAPFGDQLHRWAMSPEPSMPRELENDARFIPRQNVRVPIGARGCYVLLDCVLLLRVGHERGEEQRVELEGDRRSGGRR